MSDNNKEIPPVTGKPSVKASRKNKSKAGALGLVFLALVCLLGGLFAYLALNKDQVVNDSDRNENSMKSSLTSTRELTLPPLPPEPPKVEVREVKEEKTKEEIQEVKAIEQEVPIPITYGTLDSNGDPIPSLEELKYAAPMMGTVNSQKLSSEDKASQPQLNEIENSEGRDLSQRLKSVATPSTDAKRIKNQSLILSKGTVIECVLESRVDTTVPGMTTCVIPRNIYSMNGRVLLVEKGTKAIGEYQGSVANGLARIFMLWTELRTPHGISIQLNSPVADALGASGMGGYVDYHWWKRFGNALLFSMISDGFQYVINTANSNNNNGDVTYENTEDGMNEIIREAMRQSGDIPPTLIKNQGERVSIFVARDLNFSNVYGIEANDHN